MDAMEALGKSLRIAMARAELSAAGYGIMGAVGPLESARLGKLETTDEVYR